MNEFPVHATAQAVTGARSARTGRANNFPVPVLAEPIPTERRESRMPLRGEARESIDASNPVDGDRKSRTLVRNRSDVGKRDSRGGENTFERMKELRYGPKSITGWDKNAQTNQQVCATENDVHSDSFQSKLDPFFTAKHTVREAWKKTKRVTYWLDYCGRRY